VSAPSFRELCREIDVVILCGGRGVRLQPLTDEIPKPLVYLREQPMLKHILDIFHSWGFIRFLLCLGYRGFMIRDYFEGKQLPYSVDFDDAGADAGMIERVRHVRGRVKGRRFILTFGDAIADVNLHRLIAQHREKQSLMTMTIKQLESSFGIVKIDPNDRITDFQEKPILEEWINIGFMVMEQELFETVADPPTMVDLYKNAIASGRFHAFRHMGEHLTVNTKEERQDTESKLHGFYTVFGNTLEENNR